MVAFRLLQTSRIVRDMYFRPGNKEFYAEEVWDIFLCVALGSLHLNVFVKSVKHMNWRFFRVFFLSRYY